MHVAATLVQIHSIFSVVLLHQYTSLHTCKGSTFNLTIDELQSYSDEHSLQFYECS